VALDGDDPVGERLPVRAGDLDGVARGELSAALITRTLALPAGGLSSSSVSTWSPSSDDFPVPATV